jgi:hypothetical protein
LSQPSAGDGLVGPESTCKPQACLGCGAKIERSAVVGGQPADITKPGDFAVCAHCGEVMRWNTRLQLRSLSHEEQSIAQRHPGIRALSIAARTRAESQS